MHRVLAGVIAFALAVLSLVAGPPPNGLAVGRSTRPQFALALGRPSWPSPREDEGASVPPARRQFLSPTGHRKRPVRIWPVSGPGGHGAARISSTGPTGASLGGRKP